MAQQVFKGFKQILSGSTTTFESGILYFVRTNADKTDGYLYFNGKQYGTGKDVEDTLKALLGELPSGYTTFVDYITAVASDAAQALENAIAAETARTETTYVKLEDKTYVKEVEVNGVEATVADNKATVEIGAKNIDVEGVAISGATLTGNVEYVLNELSRIEMEHEVEVAEAIVDIYDNLSATTESIEEEKERAKAAETALSGIVVAEETRAKAAETALSGIVVAEETRALSAETILDAAIKAEETRAKAAELALSGAVDDEVARAKEEEGKIWDALSAATSAGTVELTTAETPSGDALKTYILSQGGEEVGRIDIPKDFLVTKAEIKVCEQKDVPVSGLTPGDKYIDFTINVASGTTEDRHIYLPVADLAHVYAAGNGIEISDKDVVSVKIKAGSEAFLSVDLNGLSLNGVQDAIDDAKDDAIEAAKASATTLNNAITALTASAEASATTLNNAITALTESAAASAKTLDEKIDSTKEAIDAYKVNGHAISESPVLNGGDIVVSGTSSYSANTVAEAVKALEDKIDADKNVLEAADKSVEVTEPADNVQTVKVNISEEANNALKLNSDGLFAAVYYEDEDE